MPQPERPLERQTLEERWSIPTGPDDEAWGAKAAEDSGVMMSDKPTNIGVGSARLETIRA